jgi:hypothetical protein
MVTNRSAKADEMGFTNLGEVVKLGESPNYISPTNTLMTNSWHE